MSCILSVLFLFYFKRFNSFELRFGYFILVSTFFEILAWVTTSLLEAGNNLLGLHVFTFLEFTILGLFMLQSFRLFNIVLPTLKILSVGGILIIANSLFIQNIDTYNSYSLASVKVFILAVSIYFFYIVLRSKNYSIKEVRPSLYFFTAVFLNASIVMIWYLYSNEMSTLRYSLWEKLWILKCTSTIIASLIILIGYYHLINRKENDLI